MLRGLRGRMWVSRRVGVLDFLVRNIQSLSNDQRGFNKLLPWYILGWQFADLGQISMSKELTGWTRLSLVWFLLPNSLNRIFFLHSFLNSLTACYYFIIDPETRLMVALETGGCVLFTCIPREPLPSCTHMHRLHSPTGELIRQRTWRTWWLWL